MSSDQGRAGLGDQTANPFFGNFNCLIEFGKLILCCCHFDIVRSVLLGHAPGSRPANIFLSVFRWNSKLHFNFTSSFRCLIVLSICASSLTSSTVIEAMSLNHTFLYCLQLPNKAASKSRTICYFWVSVVARKGFRSLRSSVRVSGRLRAPKQLIGIYLIQID